MTLLRLGVRSRTMLLVLVALVPLALYTLRSANDQREQRAWQVQAQAAQLARLVVSQHEKSLEAARALLATAAAEWEGGLPGADCERLLRLLERSSTVVDSLSLIRADGRVACSTMPEAAGLDISDREYFRQAMGGGEFAVSNLLRGRAKGRDVVAAAQPLRSRGGQVEAVLVAGVAIDWLPKALADAGAQEAFEALVVSSAGDVKLRFPARESGRATRVLADLRLPGTADAADYLRIGLDEAALPAGPAKGAWALLGGVLGLALLLAWLGSGFFVARPLRRLADAAERFDSGDLAARTGIAHANDEIGQLARRLDLLAAHRQQVTRALRALSAGNRTLLREQTESALLQAMCRVATEKGGYPLAMVCYANRDEAKSVEVRAFAGDEAGAFATRQLTWADTERGQGTVGKAIRGDRTVVFQSIAAEPGAAPWREDFLKRGFGAVASMPLRVAGEVIGTFTLFAREEDAFSSEELALVQEMADDLAFGIQVCRERARSEAAEREARRLATHDEGTGLANRNLLLQRLRQGLEDAAQGRKPLAVLVIHLRNLSALLDGLGYQPTQSVVREVAQRLAKLAGGEDAVAHLPPNDFALFLPGTDAEGASTLAHELLGAFDIPATAGAAQIDVQGHAGVSLYPGHGDEPELLLRRAAIAAREGTRRDLAVCVYGGATERENPGQLALAAELRRAIEGGSLELQFQPKVVLATGRVIGSEALVRWRHPGRGNIPPGQFVPLAEQTGLIRQMTYLVVEQAVRQQRAWLDAGLRLPVAVNLSVRNLYDPRLASRIEGLLATWGVPGDLLDIEITEGALVEEPEIARTVLERLRRAGCRVYIDDFGTGYSSLSYLVSLPVHALKIDRSFVVQMGTSTQARAVVSSIIGMAHQLRLGVVAEGVERAEERDALIALGCDEAQGYFIGRPAAPETFRASLP